MHNPIPSISFPLPDPPDSVRIIAQTMSTPSASSDSCTAQPAGGVLRLPTRYTFLPTRFPLIPGKQSSPDGMTFHGLSQGGGGRVTADGSWGGLSKEAIKTYGYIGVDTGLVLGLEDVAKVI